LLLLLLTLLLLLLLMVMMTNLAQVTLAQATLAQPLCQLLHSVHLLQQHLQQPFPPKKPFAVPTPPLHTPRCQD
jgi:hypothetical protein